MAHRRPESRSSCGRVLRRFVLHSPRAMLNGVRRLLRLRRLRQPCGSLSSPPRVPRLPWSSRQGAHGRMTYATVVPGPGPGFRAGPQGGLHAMQVQHPQLSARGGSRYAVPAAMPATGANSRRVRPSDCEIPHETAAMSRFAAATPPERAAGAAAGPNDQGRERNGRASRSGPCPDCHAAVILPAETRRPAIVP